MPFSLRIGASRGHVFAGEIGSEHRHTYTVMGDTVNLAARLMAASPTGSVYASGGALDRSRTLFEVTALEPFRVKGKTAPVHAFALGEELGARPSGELARAQFVGRSSALREIGELLEGTRAGVGGVVTVVGDAGMGKSRLILEALTAIPPSWRFDVRAEPMALAAPFGTHYGHTSA